MMRFTPLWAAGIQGEALVVGVVLLALTSCLTALNPVRFTPVMDAPVLAERAEGCAVEIIEQGQTLARPHRVIGHVVLEWSGEQQRDQGLQGAQKTLRQAVCERGAHFIVDFRALPRGFGSGVLYEGDIAVLLDDALDDAPASAIEPSDAGAP